MPRVSFLVANYNAERFLRDAVATALAQTGASVEVIIVDDGSSDGSNMLAAALAKEDSRVRVFQTPHNLGPAGARNLALEHASGEWVAVLDSDDLLHPERTQLLLAEAEASGADIVADDLLLFHDDGSAAPELFLEPDFARAPRWITLEEYYRRTRLFGRHRNLGFLKPMIRRAFLQRHDLQYDPALRIAEDDDLIVRAVRAGGRYRLRPEPYYFYRKHGSSISHRLSPDTIDRMYVAGLALRERTRADGLGRRALAGRHRALVRARAFVHFIEALKQRRPARAVSLALRYPGLLPLLRMPLVARLHGPRSSPPDSAPRSDGQPIIVVSRQRLSGASNGSSAYLLALARVLRDAGFRLELVQPSRYLFGRTPFYRLAPEMHVFDGVTVLRAWRLGDWLICRDPQTYILAARGLASRLLRKLGLRGRWLEDRPAPYAVGAPWSRDERLMVALAGHRIRPAAALLDYAFQVEALPYLPCGLPNLVVMHDMFHARATQFGKEADGVTRLSREVEVSLLERAEAVIAIQAEEGRFLQEVRPGRPNMVFPMPSQPVAAPSLGGPDRLLFVGSNAAPNVLGLRWFLESVWPALRLARPGLRLDVCGTVCQAFDRVPENVHLLGFVPDLSALYTQAGLVISPLRQGSGLKIKLIEALARGKACVGTTATLQGVEWLAPEAVRHADSAEAFTTGVLDLLADEAARAALGSAALSAARDHFSGKPEAAIILGWLGEAIGNHDRKQAVPFVEIAKEAAPSLGRPREIHPTMER